MNIYTFWTDLDVFYPNFEKNLMVLGAPGRSVQNPTPGPRGDVFWACGEFGLSTGRKIVADKKSQVCVKVPGGSVQMCGVFISEW